MTLEHIAIFAIGFYPSLVIQYFASQFLDSSSVCYLKVDDRCPLLIGIVYKLPILSLTSVLRLNWDWFRLVVRVSFVNYFTQ